VINHRAAAEVDAEEVHLEHTPPVAGVDLPGRTALRERDAGVGDEQIERAERGLGLGDHANDVIRTRHVARNCNAADLGRDGFDLGASPCGYPDLRARGGELTCDVGPDAAPTARHESNLAFQVVAGAVHRSRIRS
jgi:hypothetical protein